MWLVKKPIFVLTNDVVALLKLDSCLYDDYLTSLGCLRHIGLYYIVWWFTGVTEMGVKVLFFGAACKHSSSPLCKCSPDTVFAG